MKHGTLECIAGSRGPCWIFFLVYIIIRELYIYTYKIFIECTCCITPSFGFDILKVLVLLSAGEETALPRIPCRRWCCCRYCSFRYWTWERVAGGFRSRMHACICVFELNRTTTGLLKKEEESSIFNRFYCLR